LFRSIECRGAIGIDKAYGVKPVQTPALKKGVYLAAFLKLKKSSPLSGTFFLNLLLFFFSLLKAFFMWLTKHPQIERQSL
jgi:hypothetical protein